MRFLKGVFCVFVATCLAFAPIRAYAVFPVAIFPGLALVFESGALATGYAASVSLLGMAVYGIVFKDGSGSEVLRVKINPKASDAVPASWSAGATAGASPVPPSTTSPANTYTMPGYPSPSSNSASGAVANLAAYLNANPSPCGQVNGVWQYTRYSVVSSSESTGDIYGDCSPLGGSGHYNLTIAVASACPTGYTSAAAICNLTTPTAVPYPSDNKAQIDGTGATFEPVARDPDSAFPSGSGTITRSSDGKSISVSSASGSESTVVSKNVDGSITITGIKGRGDGTSDKETISISAPNSGASNGGSILTGGNKVQVSGEGSAVTSTPATGTGSLDCPSCAKETTLQGVKSGVDSLVADGVKIKEDAPAWAAERAAATSAQTSVKAQQDALTAAANAATTSGKGSDLHPSISNLTLPVVKAPESSFWFSLMPAPATCAPIAFSSTGRWAGMTINMCPVLNALRGIIEWGLYGLTALVLYGTWFRGRTSAPVLTAVR